MPNLDASQNGLDNTSRGLLLSESASHANSASLRIMLVNCKLRLSQYHDSVNCDRPGDCSPQRGSLR